jgi:hypothetical protein
MWRICGRVASRKDQAVGPRDAETPRERIERDRLDIKASLAIYAQRVDECAALRAERDALKAELAMRPTWQQWATTARAHGWIPPPPITPGPETTEGP